MSAKRDQFDRLWNASSRTKRLQFRNRMRMKLQQIGKRLTEDNARAYYMGRLKSPEPETPYATMFRERRGTPNRRRRPTRGRPRRR